MREFDISKLQNKKGFVGLLAGFGKQSHPELAGILDATVRNAGVGQVSLFLVMALWCPPVAGILAAGNTAPETL